MIVIPIYKDCKTGYLQGLGNRGNPHGNWV